MASINTPPQIGNNQSTDPNNPNAGNNTNQAKEKTSPFKEFSKQLSQTISDNMAPMNVVRQGTYKAFGNNGLTRTALGAADAGLGALEKWITGKEDDEDPSVKELKAIRESLETGVALIAQKLAGKPGDEKGKKVDFTDLKEIIKDVMTEVATTKYPYIIDQIETDVTDIKHVLEHGFTDLAEKIVAGTDKISDKLDEGFSNIVEKMNTNMEEHRSRGGDDAQGPRNKFMGDVEIVDPIKKQLTVIIKKLTYREKFEKIVVKGLIECKKVLDGISKSNRAILKAITDQCKHIEDPNAAEKELEGRNEKFMGMAEEVTPTSDNSSLNQIGGAVAGASIIDNIIDVATNFGDEIVSGLKKAGGKAVEAMETGAKWIGEKFGALKEGAKKMIGSVAETAGDLASGASKKLGSLVEGAGEMLGTAKGKIGGMIEGVAESGGGKVLGKLARFGGRAILPAMAAYDAYDGVQRTNEIMGVEGREATSGEKLQAGVSSALSGLSFGMVSDKKIAGWLKSASDATSEGMSKLFDPNSLKDPTKDTPVAPAPAAASPSVSVNNNNNTYVGSRKNPTNDDQSYNRYLDKHYAF